MSKTSHKNRPIKDDKILVGYWQWNHFDSCLIRKLFLFSGRLETKLCCVDVQTITCSKTCRFQTHRVTTQIGFCIHHVYYLQGYSSSSSSSSSASFSHWSNNKLRKISYIKVITTKHRHVWILVKSEPRKTNPTDINMRATNTKLDDSMNLS